MNDTIDPNGLVPTLLVYGILPQLPTATYFLSDQESHMHTLEEAKHEMAQVVAQLRISKHYESECLFIQGVWWKLEIKSRFIEKPFENMTDPTQ